MSNPAAWALAILATHADMLETNHIFDRKGVLIFDQIIVWERNPANGKHNVRCWLIADMPSKYPTKNEITGNWEMSYYDIDARVHRKITTKIFHETWGQDRERENKLRWPEESRVKLPSRQTLTKTAEGEE